jgi:hypothetical protein
MTTGSQKLMAPVGATSKIAPEPWTQLPEEHDGPEHSGERHQVEQHRLERQEQRAERADQQT